MGRIKNIITKIFRTIHFKRKISIEKPNASLKLEEKAKKDKMSILKEICSYTLLEKSLGLVAYFFELYHRNICHEKSLLVRQTGGLLVILDGMRRAKRLENQLKGRSGRQGDPGESHHFISIDEPLVKVFTG